MQSRNLRNLKIVLRILRIQKLCADLKIVQPVLRCICVHNIEIVQARSANFWSPTMPLTACDK